MKKYVVIIAILIFLAALGVVAIIVISKKSVDRGEPDLSQQPSGQEADVVSEPIENFAPPQYENEEDLIASADNDTDGDGLPDEWEWLYGTDPNKIDWSKDGIDSDGDRIPDESEELIGTNPKNKDTDGDGFSDGAELDAKMDPKTPQSFLSPDDDSDGLSNTDEARYGTDPNNPDTDGDTYLDGEEVKNGYNPNGEGRLE
ncbi:MAG TPA: hypothetical protein VJA22_03880 [Patescibacteria group bacterium]|nr:hypothetical protein [Patescibacteria group bacterium]